ncbi:MAG: PorP/SprF family type IX secretion system membrane protein [Bacteroidales bacterium]|nr:PorP/SprF family type IX secretion system membrane protein [Bacteroidales bacterium]
MSFFCFLGCFFYRLSAQDVLFSQFFYNPLYLNPANAGAANDPRVFLSYRNQWPAFGSTFVTYQGSYDQYIKSIKGGLGINIIRDNIAAGIINYTKVDLIYSRRYKINFDWTVQAGLQASFNFFGVSASGLNVNLPEYTTTQPDAGMGILAYSRFTQWGLSIDHLNAGYLKVNPTFVPSPMKISLYYSRNFKVFNPRVLNSRVYTLSPALLVQKQGNSLYVNYGMGVRYENLLGAAFVRTNLPLQVTNTIFAFGITLGKWQIGYSYDYNVLSLKNMMPFTGAHEVTLTATFPPDPKRQRYGPVPCPKFVEQY